MHAWSDASFADDASSRRSTIGYFIFWNGYVVSRISLKSKRIASSTTKSEFISATEALRTARYMKGVNQEVLQYDLFIKLFQDNQTCIKWLKNPTGYDAKAKHIDIYYYFALRRMKRNLSILPAFLQLGNLLILSPNDCLK